MRRRRIPEECRGCLGLIGHTTLIGGKRGCVAYSELFPLWGRDELRKEGMCPGRHRIEQSEDLDETV